MPARGVNSADGNGGRGLAAGGSFCRRSGGGEGWRGRRAPTSLPSWREWSKQRLGRLGQARGEGTARAQWRGGR
jgi:hypothetical protein